MTDYGYPSAAELVSIAQDKMARLTAQRPIFDEFPITTSDTPILLWEQLDNYQGLQQIRGINGQPPSVRKTGISRFMLEPGIYGEFEAIDEREMLFRRQMGSFNAPVDVSDLVMLAQDKLLGRRLDRIEKIIWDLLQAGTFSVAGPTGATLATDAYTFQTFTSAVPWATSATATPLADLRAAKLKHRGHSVDFGAGAKAYANTNTINEMLTNTNSADVYGRRTSGYGTINSLPGMNQLYAADALPALIEYDEGYMAEGTTQDALGTFTPFIPDGYVILIGKRPAGQSVGNYRYTRNASNPGMAPGPAMKVIDRGETEMVRSIEVHDGHNGGPVMFFPSAVVVMHVS